MTALIRYDAACKAIAEAFSVDEVKDIRDKSVALAAYARQAKNKDLEADAIEIRLRAERRIGQMMEQGKEDRASEGGFRRDDGFSENPSLKPTLKEVGIDKNLANRARRGASKSDKEFDDSVKSAREKARRAANKALNERDKAEQRAERERDLAAKQRAMPDKKYGVIYADPPWKFAPYSDVTGMDRSADNHYPTMDLAAIKAVPVQSADDAVLFLWATVPMLIEAIQVLEAWGFEYKSNFAWVKHRPGTGYWARNRHELLLVGTKGKIPAPAPGQQFDSVIEAPVGEHSAKPFAVHEMIEEMFPTLPRIELFARERFEGWDSWGNEIAA